MCGIAGYISNDKWNTSDMLSSLHHRGPDNTGEFHTTINDRNVFLGHKRLSILDLSAEGNQPMKNKDESIVVSYNGEIYNFQTLKEQFLKGYAFKSNSDTEVLFKLYELKGISFLKELNGDFAISILDKRENKLFLIRDRIGVKPLYIFKEEDHLLFASEIKSLLAAGVPAELNTSSLRDYFVFKYVPKNDTLFKNIYRIPPGHYLTYDFTSHTAEPHQYWNSESTSYSGISYEDAQQEAYKLIEDACKMRLVSDVPVGSFFSGGLDSSIIAHFLRGKDDIAYYTAGKKAADIKKEGTTSDIHYAKKLAKEWGISLNEISIGSNQLTQQLIQKTVHFSDDIIADGSQIPSYLITQKASENSTVILSGMGADELFLGYAGHQLMLLDKRISSIPSIVRNPLLSFFRNLNAGRGSFKAYKRYLQKLGSYSQYGNMRYALYNIVGDFESANSIFSNSSGVRDGHLESFLSSYFPEGKNPFDGLKKFEGDNFLIKNLHYTDRMCMANSVENRVPFLDHRLVSFANSLPTEYKLGHFGKTKRILKDAFSRHIPSYITNRRKAGFGMPLRSILSDAQRIEDLMDISFFNNFDCFDTAGIQRIIDEHISGTKDNSALIYALITFQEWYKIYIR